MSVHSTQNKSLLWQLLSNHPNQKTNPKKFQHVLEYRVTEMNKNRFKFNNDLMIMNKQLKKNYEEDYLESYYTPALTIETDYDQTTKEEINETDYLES